MVENSIQIKDLTFIYSTLWGIRNLNLEIPKGSFSAILGPNGAGKSTLLKILLRVLSPYRGSITVNGKELKQMNQHQIGKLMGYVPQETNFAFDFKVYDILMMGRFVHQKLWEYITPDDEQVVHEIMDLTEITEFKNRSFSALSGGEKKRILIGSALAQEPSFLLLDEPTAGLDVHYQTAIMQLLKRINEERGVTIVMVTHDINFAAKYCNYFSLMVNGRLISSGGKELLKDEKLLREVFSTNISIDTHPLDDDLFIYFER
ncbi:MAG: ABC transporter ATP-binding protein [Calditrichia bacterium]